MIDNRRVSALRFGDPRTQAMLAVMLLFVFLPMGFSNRQVREHVQTLLCAETGRYGASQATYDLRRMRMRGLIERLPRSHRYRVTERGLRVALYYGRIYRRTLNPALVAVFDDKLPPKLGRIIRNVDQEISRLREGQPLAA